MENNVILVVDDDTNILAIIEMYLKKEGYTVATCTRGDAAIESFHDVKPTLVPLDVMLPGMDGWTVLEKLRAESTVPVIIAHCKGRHARQDNKGLSLARTIIFPSPLKLRSCSRE